MSVHASDSLRNARVNIVESHIGPNAILQFRTGAKPAAGCGAARTGTLVASMTLPADWMNAASGGSATKLGTWQDPTADNAGVVGYWSILDSTGTTCHLQGDVTATGGGGEITLDNTNVAQGQQVTVTSFTLVEGNAP